MAESLEERVIELQKKGWILLSSTPTTAQLRKPKRGCSLPLLIFTNVALTVGFVVSVYKESNTLAILFLVADIFFFIFLITFLFRREKLVLLVKKEDGTIQETKRKI